MIPYGRQHISEEDVTEVVKTLKSDFLTQGPVIKQFEECFANYVGSKYAVAVSNGTAALHLCTLALGVDKGQKVITTPITFAASANCVLYCNGDVVFSDIDSETLLIDLNKVELLLEEGDLPDVKGLIVVNFAGRVCNLEEVRRIADKFGLWVIEDACHSPGGFFKDSSGKIQMSGNGIYTDLSIFSFHPVKHIATGEGGMITTNNVDLYTKLITLRTHGITREGSLFENEIDFAVGAKATEIDSFPGWYMEMQTLGYNYRLTDFQAALGISQLKRADYGLARRREIAKKYNDCFKGKPFIKNQSGYVEGHAYHLYVIEVPKRLELYNYLKEKGILTQVHYIPCHLMPFYRKRGWKEGDMINAEDYYKRCLSLPIYPTLNEAEQEFVINSINEFYV